MLVLLFLAAPGLAEEAPSGRLDLELKSMLGHELGYGRPQVGSRLKLNLKDLSQHRSLQFGSKFEYVPLVSALEITDVESNGGKWSSFRARSGNASHQVTFDVTRVGAENQVRAWILVESQGRIQGVLYLEGSADGSVADFSPTEGALYI